MTRRAALATLLALALVWFGVLGLRPLYKTDESRYGEIPREMVASGDWLTPRLNGFKYFEKPPLQYWATAAFFEVFGVADWVARLWTALAGFAGILLTLFAANRLFGPPAGYFAAAVLVGSPLYVILGQVNTLDMGLALFMSAAVFAFALGHMLLFWVACALAVLSKGLVGVVLPGAAIALYVLVQRDWQLLRRMRMLPGALLFLLVAAPWFLAVSAANPEFAHFFFIQEHLQRFTTTMHHRVEPAWFFALVLGLGMAPWLVPAIVASVRAAHLPTKGPFNAELFLALWCLVVFVFFSASQSKLPPYILPIVPALAVLIGRWMAMRETRGVMLAQGALALALGIAVALLAPDYSSRYPAATPWAVAAGGVLAGAAALSIVSAWRRRIGAAAAWLAIGGLGMTQVAAAGHSRIAEYFSVAPTLARLAPAPDPAAAWFAVHSYDHTMPWSLRRPVTMVHYKDELGAAIAWEPGKFLVDLRAFEAAWQAAPQAYAFIALRDFEALRRELAMPLEVAVQGPRYVIVRKP